MGAVFLLFQKARLHKSLNVRGSFGNRVLCQLDRETLADRLTAKKVQERSMKLKTHLNNIIAKDFMSTMHYQPIMTFEPNSNQWL